MNQREQARILARLGVRYRSASYIPMPDSKSRIATSPRRTASAKISRIGRASSVLNSAMVRRI